MTDKVNEVVVRVWQSDKGWCVQVDGEDAVYVYQTMRAALRMAEGILKAGE